MCARIQAWTGVVLHTLILYLCIWVSTYYLQIQFVGAGNPYDQVARQYVSDSLSGNKTNGYSGGIGKNVSRHEVGPPQGHRSLLDIANSHQH